MTLDFISTENELRILSNKLIELSETYYKIREEYGKAKCELFVLLVPKQKDAKYARAALERQVMMMISEIEEGDQKDALIANYHEFLQLEQKYKGLERLLAAYETKVSSLQSLMKWQRENG